MKQLVFIFTLLLAGLGMSSVNAAPLPCGNYFHTCNRCHTVPNPYDRGHSSLICHCQDANGFDRRTAIRRPYHCSFIENINGQLECTGERSRRAFPAGECFGPHYPVPHPVPGPRYHHRPVSGPNLPPGNYLRSCRACSVNGQELSCECQRANGKWVTSRFIGRCNGGISNQNGSLVCR